MNRRDFLKAGLALMAYPYIGAAKELSVDHFPWIIFRMDGDYLEYGHGASIGSRLVTADHVVDGSLTYGAYHPSKNYLTMVEVDERYPEKDVAYLAGEGLPFVDQRIVSDVGVAQIMVYENQSTVERALNGTRRNVVPVILEDVLKHFGTFSGERLTQDWQRAMTFDLSEGHSGAPVYTKELDLIGVITGIYVGQGVAVLTRLSEV
ncbi:hypothetical protein H6504_01245 [Candidatus Woesearchaeota archaeon]|nr:hypothetical protein [Candidatus Woesearchaeota archaeon]